MRRALLTLAAVAAVAAGYLGSHYAPSIPGSADAAAIAPTEGTATFTFTNTGTATYPIPPAETVTVTVTTEPPPATTAPPTTTTEPLPPAQCADQADNDADGLVDLADPGCVNAADNDEFNAPPPPPPSGANVFLSPSGSDTSSACGQMLPCKTFARAYTVAVSGAVVSVAAGVYPSQKFAGGYQSSQPGGTKAITFRGEPGNAVRQINTGSPNIVFDGINVDAGGTKTSGAGFENAGANNVVFKNGSIGNVNDEKGALVGGNLLIDNVNFHDVTLTDASVHNECLFVLEGQGITIRNSVFTNCRAMGLFFTTCGPCTPNYSNVTVDGNTFNPVTGGDQTIHFGWIGANGSKGTMTNWKVRNNSFAEPVFFDPGDGSPVLGIGNVFCGNTGVAPASWKTACQT